MTITLVLPPHLSYEIRSAAQLPTETAGVMLVSAVKAPKGDVRLLARQMHWVDESSYLARNSIGMCIRPEGYIRPLAIAEDINAACIWVHTHPGIGSKPKPSGRDRVVDRQIADLFRIRSGSPYYGALIFAPETSGLAFTGHLDQEHLRPIKIERMWEVGSDWRLTRAFDSDLPQLSDIFDRNVRAFGPAIQQTLGNLRVGVVGCGGTGSAVAEQLVRLGVRHIILADPDNISQSNLTRMYGSTLHDVGLPKVNVLARFLRRLAPAVECEAVTSMLTIESTARRFLGCDVLFGCTDDNAGRLVLSRLATYMLTPVIDCGVLLSSDCGGELIGIDGRITILSPGQACLVCRGRIDLARAGAELLTPEERVRREDEGYAPALAGIEPAVVTFTTLVAATAVSELLERLIGYGPADRPSEVLLRCHEREISTNVAVPVEGHYCHLSSGKLGIGVTEPFLEQTWPT